jgi:hypothetical protein
MRVALAVALFAAACGPRITVTQLNMPPHPMSPRPPETMQVFATHVPDGVVDVYLIEATGGADDERMPAIGQRAAQLGCDGLAINNGVPNTTSTAVAFNPRGGVTPVTSTTAGFMSAICVVYATAPAPVPAPAPAPAGPP